MDFGNFLQSLRSMGFTLKVEGGTIKVDPSTKLTDEQKQIIREHKHVLIYLLTTSANHEVRSTDLPPSGGAERASVLEAGQHFMGGTFLETDRGMEGCDPPSQAATAAVPSGNGPPDPFGESRQVDPAERVRAALLHEATAGVFRETPPQPVDLPDPWDRIRNGIQQGYRYEFTPKGGISITRPGKPLEGPHVTCKACAHWQDRCHAGFTPSDPEADRLCGRFAP